MHNNLYGKDIVEIDVSLLPPPEPMVKILSTLSQLSEQQILKVNHRREPFPLYEKLTTAGWYAHCEKLADEHFVIYIYRANCHDKFSHLFAHLTRCN